MTTTRLVALAACAVLALGGCSDEPEPQISNPSPNPTSTPSDDDAADPDEPPELPAEAKENTKAGAEAFVKHYWELANFSQETGSTDPVSAVSADTCAGCQGAISYIDRVYGRGGSILGGANRVQSATADPIFSGTERDFDVSFTVTNKPQTIKIPGEKDEKLPASEVSGHMVVNWTDGAFRADVLEVT